ncbi:MAG: hypothetical protein LBC95_01910 [Candidatus Nomurabacteria bacterium]|jgi:hypothetical protein|nr:hypothetical protein [Candidatus Nomurabacteria bacterium]
MDCALGQVLKSTGGIGTDTWGCAGDNDTRPAAACNADNQFLQWDGSAYGCKEVAGVPVGGCSVTGRNNWAVEGLVTSRFGPVKSLNLNVRLTIGSPTYATYNTIVAFIDTVECRPSSISFMDLSVYGGIVRILATGAIVITNDYGNATQPPAPNFHIDATYF